MTGNALPDRKTCRDCVHIYTCEALDHTRQGDTVCYYMPSRFEDSTSDTQAAKPASDTPRDESDDQHCPTCGGNGGHLEGCRGITAYQELETLVREVLDWHSSPDSGDYNECDKSPCMWCMKALAALGESRKEARND